MGFIPWTGAAKFVGSAIGTGVLAHVGGKIADKALDEKARGEVISTIGEAIAGGVDTATSVGHEMLFGEPLEVGWAKKLLGYDVASEDCSSNCPDRSVCCRIVSCPEE